MQKEKEHNGPVKVFGKTRWRGGRRQPEGWVGDNRQSNRERRSVKKAVWSKIPAKKTKKKKKRASAK